ncbi:MAG TPA: primosomal protein N' [Candidatus Saccharimonadia bacterium]|nr:primosomal protein N' [Candidatus Saccharimonadia bacterium]
MEPRQYYLITPLVYTGAADAFTYHSVDHLPVGKIVRVPIGRRQVSGIIVAEASRPEFNTRNITEVLELAPVPVELMQLAQWLSAYYAASPSSVWSTMLPAGLLKSRRPSKPAPERTASGLPTDPLTAEQSLALTTIQSSTHSTALLQGVTGSGKTRIYMTMAAEALQNGRSCLILVPEITLTPQIVAQFEKAFGAQVLASHSKLTESQRHKIWIEAHQAAANGNPRIIIGPRSCLFMPASKLGLIVIDECHETSYKQEQHPRYHAIPTAAKRAHECGARLVLGSATPGMQELYLAQMNKIEHVMMRARVNKIAHSEGKIIDLRDKNLFTKSKFITQPLLGALAETLENGRQSLLYLNRRGSASSQICSDCGFVNNCPNCQLPLTFHADLMRLICHHCNFRTASPAVCPECNSMDLRLLGGGTKRIEAEISHLFPDARIARLDRDSATISHIQTVFRGMKNGDLDIIIGTQMIAKGLDLPAIDTVGIVNADTMLHLPDYTAAERTYQLISQVSGRAGRGDRAGQVFIQTYTPEHPAIQAAATGAYNAFASSELRQRQELNYPPYVYLLKLTLASPSRESALRQSTDLAVELRKRPGLAVIGPAPAFIETSANKHYWIITVKSKNRKPLIEIARELPGTNWTADPDPINLL